MKKTKREMLIDALIKERDLFASRDGFTKEHDIVIEYLKTGETEHSPEDWDLLYAAMYDFDMLCADYLENQ